MPAASTLVPRAVQRIAVLAAILMVGGLLAFSLGGCDSSCRVKGDPSVPIGGAFELVDQTGKTVTDQDLKGRYQLIYFGYTYCPDVCPTELQTMSTALDLLGDRAAAIQPIFITVDPERDDVATMADYVAHFYPSMVGLTGTAEQVAAAAGTFRVFYSKEPIPDAPPDQYLMNHSSFVYVMDCQGRYIRHFSTGISAEDMADALKSLL